MKRGAEVDEPAITGRGDDIKLEKILTQALGPKKMPLVRQGWEWKNIHSIEKSRAAPPIT